MTLMSVTYHGHSDIGMTPKLYGGCFPTGVYYSLKLLRRHRQSKEKGLMFKKSGMFNKSDDGTCAFCDKALAWLGVAIGAAFLYISFDILTGGRLTGMISRQAAIVESDEDD